MMTLDRALLFVLLLGETAQHSFGYVHPSNIGKRSFSRRQELRLFCASDSYVTSTHNSFLGQKQFVAMNRQKTSLNLSSSNLFASHERQSLQNYHRLRTSTEASASPDDDNNEKTIIRKVYDATFGRLKAVLIFIVKNMFLKSFNKLKSIFRKGRGDDLMDDATPVNDDEIDASKVEKRGLSMVDVKWDEETVASKDKKETSIPNIDAEEESAEISSTAGAQEDSNKGLNREIESLITQDEANVNQEAQSDTTSDSVEEQAADEEFVGDKSLQTAESAIIENAKEPTVEIIDGEKKSPKGSRWAVSAPDTDLSGNWKILVTDDFKEKYDQYLKRLGQPSLVRSVAVSIVEMTTEEVIQTDEGRSLCIKGKNLRGIWDRTLIASGSDFDGKVEQEHTRVPLVTADKEKVEAESWWEDNGTVHRSWLRGGKKYGGGDFESKRYLIDDDKLVCESQFHPQGGDKEKAVIQWTFERVG